MTTIELYMKHHLTTCGTCRPDFICRAALTTVAEIRRRTGRGGQIDGGRVELARASCRTAGHCLALTAERGCHLFPLSWCWPLCRQRSQRSAPGLLAQG